MMKHFIQLVNTLDRTALIDGKVDVIVDYLQAETNLVDKLWMVALFCDKLPTSGIRSTMLKEWALEYTELPSWLFQDVYKTVGDLSETIALLQPKDIETANNCSLGLLINQITMLKNMDIVSKKSSILATWRGLDTSHLYIFNKLLTSSFRLGITRLILAQALARHLDKDEKEILQRLQGEWSPFETTFEELLLSPDRNDHLSKPFPFQKSQSFNEANNPIVNMMEWAVEYIWYGIRTQLIKRQGKLFIWSSGLELVTEKLPELSILQDVEEDDFVIDGEIVAYNVHPLDYKMLQARLDKKNLDAKVIKSCPIAFFAFDLLEHNGQDCRSEQYMDRRSTLTTLFQSIAKPDLIKLSPYRLCSTWEEVVEMRSTSAANHALGIMIKKTSASYFPNDEVANWWKWKTDPYTVDAVLIYAQKGQGERAGLFTEFTFAVWSKGENGEKSLVPFTKASTGLTDTDYKEITAFVKKNTLTKFGPVCSVKAELVFEIAFEGISSSTRHKCGIALRSSRIKAWRKDKLPADADSLDYLIKHL